MEAGKAIQNWIKKQVIKKLPNSKKHPGILLFDSAKPTIKHVGKTYRSGKRKIGKAERKMLKRIKQKMRTKENEILESLES